MDRLDNASKMVRDVHDRLQRAQSGEINDAVEALACALEQVLAELRGLRMDVDERKLAPAHVDLTPTIAPGTMRIERCARCGGKVNYVSPWDGWRCTRCGKYHGGKAKK